MHERAKELIKQLAAELEFVTIPAMDPAHYDSYAADIMRGNYETAKDVQSELKTLYGILSKY